LGTVKIFLGKDGPPQKRLARMPMCSCTSRTNYSGLLI